MNPQKRYSFKHIAKRCVTYMIPFTTMGLLLYCWRGGKLDNYWYFRSLVEFSMLLFAIYAGATKFSLLGTLYSPFVLLCFFFNNLGIKPYNKEIRLVRHAFGYSTHNVRRIFYYWLDISDV